jgi:hypothetical protein
LLGSRRSFQNDTACPALSELQTNWDERQFALDDQRDLKKVATDVRLAALAAPPSKVS